MSIFSWFRKKRSTSLETEKRYTLRFKKEDGIWYIVLPNWKGPKSSLAMVDGADDALDTCAKGGSEVTLDVYVCDAPKVMAGYYTMSRYDWSTTGGAYYWSNVPYLNKSEFIETVWLCPVTLFVCHQYPPFFYFKPIEVNSAK